MEGYAVRLSFQRTPWDLYVAVGYTIAATSLLLVRGVGSVFAIFLVLFAPGYVLMAALFPDAKEIDWTERIALSLGVSVAVVPATALLLNFTPLGIRFASVVETIALLTSVIGLAAVWRRMRLPVEKRLAASVDVRLPDWSEYSQVDKAFTVGLAASIILGVALLASLLATPQPSEHFTDFYILGAGGKGSDYPTRLNVSQPASVILGVVNYESASVTYTIRGDLVGVRIVYNETGGFNETVDVNRTSWSWTNITLANGQNWTRAYTFSISSVGFWKVQFLLFRGGIASSPYREIHLYVRVA